jgi:hypothetical protein
VYESGGQYWHARRYACQLLGLEDAPLPDSPIQPVAGDRYLGLDLLPHAVPHNAALFDWLIVYVVHNGLRQSFKCGSLEQLPRYSRITSNTVTDGEYVC